MNLLFISITISCNKKCYYCPVGKWLRPVDFIYGDGLPANNNNNNNLLQWLDRYIDPAKWLVEITGGEPGLYKEIDTLIPELNKRNYHGLIKTNGSLPIPKSKNFQLISSWHKDADIPKYYDKIVIIRNPSDNWKAKEDYCKSNNIPYATTLFDEFYLTGKTQEAALAPANKIIECLHISSRGNITPCARVPADYDVNVFNMSAPKPLEVYKQCPSCKNINDFEVFLPDRLKQKINDDYQRR